MRKAIIIILCALGMIVGVIVGEQMAGTSLNWLSIGGNIGLEDPLLLDLGVIELTLVIFALLSKWITSWLKI